MPYSYAYPRPAVTVDLAVFTLQKGELTVLLIRRKKAPFKGHWALPGGFVDQNEALERAAGRELHEETGLSGVLAEQLGAFGDPGRDPRGHVVSVAYYTFVTAPKPVSAGDDAAAAQWLPVRELPIDGASSSIKLAFDHTHILTLAVDRLRAQLAEPARTMRFDIVPSRFTLTELQHVYEAVLGRALDKRNFRAKLFTQKLVEPVASARRVGRHRPAQLYRWRLAEQRKGK